MGEKMPKISLVDLLFWLHSGYFGKFAHFNYAVRIHLCQLKLGMKENTTQNNLY